MGDTHSRHAALAYYGQQTHSVEGEVPVYRLKGEALYVLGKEGVSAEVVAVARMVGAERCRFLCEGMGRLLEEGLGVKGDCGCLQEDGRSRTFWTFQNFTIREQIQQRKELGEAATEEEVWRLVREVGEACLLLGRHRLFVDCTMENVHLSPLKHHQLYWAHARPGNGHRLYYRMLAGHSANETPMSPEEMNALRKGKIAARIDLEKCTVHSLGVLALLFANNLTDYALVFDSTKLEVRQDSLTALLSQARHNYSPSLVDLLASMVHESPGKRPSFSVVLEEVRCFLQLQSSRACSSKSPPELSTCRSSKLSVRQAA